MADLFERVPLAYREPIGLALDAIGPRCRELIQPRFLCGVDPHFVGLHYSAANEYFDPTYPHCSFGSDTRPRSDQQTTIVLPAPLLTVREGAPWCFDFVAVFVHELGHAVDEALGFPLEVPFTTLYSNKNWLERFAEAFKMLLMPPSADWALCMQAEEFRPFREAVSL